MHATVTIIHITQYSSTVYIGMALVWPETLMITFSLWCTGVLIESVHVLKRYVPLAKNG